MGRIIRVALGLIILNIVAAGTSAADIGDLTARDMYVSCILAQSMEPSVLESSLYSPTKCSGAVLSLIVQREGKDNKNAGQEDSRLNFCLPKTTRPEVVMMDAFIMEYERSFGSPENFNPGSMNGVASFALALIKRYPCD